MLEFEVRIELGLQTAPFGRLKGFLGVAAILHRWDERALSQACTAPRGKT